MASTTTSFVLDKHHQQFIDELIASGRYGTASEVMRDALRRLEKDELELRQLRLALQEGRDSGRGRTVRAAVTDNRAKRRAKRAA